MKNLERKTWQDFRETGLLFFANLVLQPFGWVMVIKTDEGGNIIECFPCRTKYRGFDEKSQDEEHIKIAKYLAEVASGFPDEIK